MNEKVAIVKFKNDAYLKSYYYKIPDYMKNLKVGDYAIVASQYSELGYSIVKVVKLQAFNAQAKAYLVQKIKTKRFLTFLKKEKVQRDKKEKKEELENKILKIVKGKQKEKMIENIAEAYKSDEELMKMYTEYQKIKGE